MDCTKYIELMSAALDGECTAAERRELDAHLAVCPECAALFEILSANAKAARELDCEVPAGLKERILNNLPRQEQPKKQGKVIHWKRWIPVAAAACLVLVVSLVPSALGGGSAAPKADNANPASSLSVFDYAKTGAAAEADGAHSHGVYPVPGEAPTANEPGSAPSEDPGAPADPAHYWYDNQQAIRVGYSDELTNSARIVGSVDSLNNYLAQFNIGPEQLDGTYTEEYFRTHRLLCVTVVAGSGSYRFEIAPRGLLRNSVTILEHVPEVGTCDMAAWLLVAEVDSMFDDGDVLEVNFTR